MHAIIDGVELRWPWGMAKAGMRRGNDLPVPTQKLKKPNLEINILHAVQQEDRLTLSATDHFEFDIPNRYSIHDRWLSALHVVISFRVKWLCRISMLL